MKKSILLTSMILFLLATAFSFAQNNNETEKSPIGKITFLKGKCYVRHEDSNNFINIDVDNPVFTSDTIKTDNNSKAEIELVDGSIISLLNNSEITINQSMLEKERFTNLGMLYGTLQLFVKKLAGGSFNINTLLVTAGIRGTEFTIATRDDGAVLVDVKEGIVEVENTNEKSALKKGDIEMYTITGEKKRYKGRIDYTKWRNEAIQKIKKNPELYLKKMLEREKRITERLKVAHSKLENYRREWINFLKRVRFLDRRGMYEQEKRLIRKQIQKTRRGLIFVNQTRRQLTAIRSIIAISYRIEKNMERTQANVSILSKIRREYRKINYIVERLKQTELTLRRVLYFLNIKYYKLNKKDQEL